MRFGFGSSALAELQVAPPRISSPVEPDKEECIRARKDKITASPRLWFSLHQRRRGSSAIGATSSPPRLAAKVGNPPTSDLGVRRWIKPKALTRLRFFDASF